MQLVEAIRNYGELVVDLALTQQPAKENVFHVAASCGKPNAIRALASIDELQLKSAYDLESRDAQGRTALARAVGSGSTEAVNALVRMGCEVPPDMLALAAKGGASEITASLATEQSVAELGKGGKRALHQVADGSGDVATARALLDAGADVDAEDLDKMTALEIATINGHKGLVEMLLEARANPLNTDRFGASPLSRALGHPESGVLPALLAAISLGGIKVPEEGIESIALDAVKKNEAWVLEDLLPLEVNEHGVKAHIGEYECGGWPLLWWAVHFGQSETALEWIASGRCNQAAVRVTSDGRTIFHWMADWGCETKAVRPLIGAKVDVSHQDAEGNVALITASRTGHKALAQLLMGDQPPDVVKQAAEVASAAGHVQLAQWLSQASGGLGKHSCERFVASDGGGDAGSVASRSPGQKPWFQATRSAITAPGAGVRVQASFVSPEFPPNKTSLGQGKATTLARVSWKRVAEVCGGNQAVLFGASLASGKSITNPNMDTGQIGSAYFWAALAACEVAVIQDHFDVTQLTPSGKYVVTTTHGKQVVIDDYIPCIGGTPAYGKIGSTNEAWSLLICKAYAQVLSSQGKQVL